MTRSIAQGLVPALVLSWLAGPPVSVARAEPAATTAPPASPVSAIRSVEIDGLEKLEFRHVINQAKERVFPAVVFVKCVSENYDTGKRITQEASGSGVLISPKGELLTNWHVVDKAVEVRCLLFDGQALRAKVLGTDKDTDLALLQLAMPENAKPLPYAKLGDSGKLAEGQFVMAMGAPWGLSRSVSLGILSCTRRFLPGSSEYSLWLQTDAAISPGNSGGPLVDTEGMVVGLNARGMMAGGDMGFAIPADTMEAVVPQLREYGKVNWSWTGLQLQPIKDFNRDMYFDGTEGVIVADTDPDSPARAAGIQAWDRILKIDGKAVNAVMEEDLPAARRTLGLLPKKQAATVELLRGGKQVTVQMTPREKGKVEGDQLDCPRWDLTVKAINQFDNPDLYFHRKAGVFVQGVRQPGNAATAGLQAQDIVVKIGGKEVSSLDDVKQIHKKALENLGESHRVLITVLRNGLMKQVVMDFSRDHSKE
jgi:serine protease Do